MQKCFSTVVLNLGLALAICQQVYGGIEVKLSRDLNRDGAPDLIRVTTSVYELELKTTEYMGYIRSLKLRQGSGQNLLRADWLGIHELPCPAGLGWWVAPKWSAATLIKDPVFEDKPYFGKEFWADFALYKDKNQKEVAIPVYHHKYPEINLMKNPEKIKVELGMGKGKDFRQIKVTAHLNRYFERIWNLKFFEDNIEVESIWKPIAGDLYFGINSKIKDGPYVGGGFNLNIPAISLNSAVSDNIISLIRRGERGDLYPEVRGRGLDGFDIYNPKREEGLIILYHHTQLVGLMSPTFIVPGSKTKAWYWDLPLLAPDSAGHGILPTPRAAESIVDPDATFRAIQLSYDITEVLQGVTISKDGRLIPESGLSHTYYLIPHKGEELRTINGRITDEKTAKPVVGAEITAWQGLALRAVTKSGEEGEYKLRIPCVGDYEVRVTGAGHEPFANILNIKTENPKMDFSLTPGGRLPWLRAEGRHIRDENGNYVSLYGGPAFSRVAYPNKLEEEDRYSVLAKYCRIPVRSGARIGYNHQRLVLGETEPKFFFPQEQLLFTHPWFKNYSQEYLKWRIDSALEQAKKEGTYLIVDFHRSLMGGDYFGDKEAYKDFIKMWGILADRYKDEPNVAAYEIINEPGGSTFSPKFLKELYDETIKEIRKYDQKHMLVFGHGWGQADLSVWLKVGLPNDPFNNLLFSTHHYPCSWNLEDGGIREHIRQAFEIQDRFNIPVWLGEWADGRTGLRDRYVKEWVGFTKDLHWHFALWVGLDGYEEWNPREAIRFWHHKHFGPYICSSDTLVDWEDYDADSRVFTCKLKDGPGDKETELAIKIPVKVYPYNRFEVICNSPLWNKEYDTGKRILSVRCRKGENVILSIGPEEREISLLKIRNVKAKLLNNSSVEISWKTNRRSISMVSYATQEDYKKYGMFFSQTPLDKKMKKAHRIKLAFAGDTLCYRVGSRDKDGNLARSQAMSLSFPQEAKGKGKWIVYAKGIIPSSGIWMDKEGNFWTACLFAHCVRKTSKEGEVLKVIGAPDTRGTDPCMFDSPKDVLIDRNGNIWITDTKNNRIQRFDSKGDYLDQISQFHDSSFKDPTYLALDKDGNIWVADRLNYRLIKFSPEGKYSGEVKVIPDFSRSIGIMGIAFDVEGHIYAVLHDKIYKLDPVGGKHIKNWANKSSIFVHQPQDIVIDDEGKIYAACAYDNRLQIFAASGRHLKDITSFPGGMAGPCGLYLDRGTLYITFLDKESICALDTKAIRFEEKSDFEAQPAMAKLPSGRNLLANSSFEDGAKAPSGWKSCLDGFEWDRDVAHTGKCSIRLGGDKDKYYGCESALIRVKQGKKYTVIGRVKTENATGVTYMKVSLYDLAGNWGVGTGQTDKICESKDWRPVSLTLTPFMNGTVQIICCSDNNSGFAWLDDVEVIEVE